MDDLQKKILEIFRDKKVPVGGVCKPQVIDFTVRTWQRNEIDRSPADIERLINDGFIGLKDGWYTLEQKGYDELYKNYKLEGTEDIIMAIFRKHKTGKNEVIMGGALTSVQQSVDRYHFDHFQQALQSLQEKGWIKGEGSNMIRLTEIGYNQLYS
jgi:hypothetical protein